MANGGLENESLIFLLNFLIRKKPEIHLTRHDLAGIREEIQNGSSAPLEICEILIAFNLFNCYREIMALK